MKTSIKFVSYSKRAKWVIWPTLAIVMANFGTFVAGSIYFGGDALNGYTKAGQYFVCAHGLCNQVSSQVWHYSYWHAVSAFAGFLLLFVELAIFVNTGDIGWDAP